MAAALFQVSMAPAAANATLIAASQSPAANAILLQPTVSGATNAATAAGSNVLSFATLPAGVAVGQAIGNSSAVSTIQAGTLVASIVGTNVMMSLPAIGAGVANGNTITFTSPIVLDIPRRIAIASGGNDSGITFTVVGTSRSGALLSETIAGANIGTAITTQDFATVSYVTHTGSVAGTVTVGTSNANVPRL